MNKKNQSVTERKIILDGHAHVFTTSLPLMKGHRYAPEAEALPETYFKTLKSANFDGAVLVQPSFLGTDNSYMLQVIEAAEKDDGLALYGVAVLDPEISFEEMHTLQEKGIIGVRLNLVDCEMPNFRDQKWSSFLNQFERLGWHLEIHVEGKRLLDFVNDVPYKGYLVIDHFGLPSSEKQLEDNIDGILLLHKFKDVFVKISGAYRVFPDMTFKQSANSCLPLIEILIEKIGSNNLIWGSDWPWTRHEKGQHYCDCVQWGNSWLGPDFATFPEQLLTE